MIRALAALLLIFTCARAAHAQSEEKRDDSERFVNSFGVFGGRMMPENVDHVTDIYPYFGARYSKAMWGAFPEISGYFINAYNVSFYTASLSFAFPDMLVGFIYIPFIGIDMHEIQGYNKRTGAQTLSTGGGLHLGVSPVIDITPRVAIRTDIKFDFGPGYELYVGSGVMVAF